MKTYKILEENHDNTISRLCINSGNLDSISLPFSIEIRLESLISRIRKFMKILESPIQRFYNETENFKIMNETESFDFGT